MKNLKFTGQEHQTTVVYVQGCERGWNKKKLIAAGVQRSLKTPGRVQRRDPLGGLGKENGCL